MTCAAHVQAVGQGFPGQLGVFGDQHLPGLTRLAHTIKAKGANAAMQLHHAGNRSPKDLVGTPVCPSADEKSGARGLTLAEVEQLRDDFIAAARRAEKAGFDGVEIHGAHVLGDPRRSSCRARSIRRERPPGGGSPENRARIVLEIIDGVRAPRAAPISSSACACRRSCFGLKLMEIRDLAAARVLQRGQARPFPTCSLWDYAKEPVEEEHQGRTLLSYFTELPRGDVRLGAAFRQDHQRS